jgi:dTMP kinase
VVAELHASLRRAQGRTVDGRSKPTAQSLIAELLEEAKSRPQDGALVIIDRYYYSTVAYQGARGLDPARLLAKNRAFAPKPDLVVLVDVDPRLSLERIAARGEGVDLFETLEALTKVRAIFLALNEPHIARIDGAHPADEVFQRVVTRIVNEGPLKGLIRA